MNMRQTMQTVIVKLSGKLTETAEARQRVLAQVKQLSLSGYWPVIVHGGGKQLDDIAAQTAVPRQIVNGRRVTCAKTLELAKMTFMGAINTDIVADCHKLGISAIGLSGAAAGLIRAVRRPPQACAVGDDVAETHMIDFGFVGDITTINVGMLYQLMLLNHVPVIAPLAITDDGQILNVNADTVAGEIAVACEAHHLLMLGDTDGIYATRNDPSSLIRRLAISDIDHLIASRQVDGGMLPKLAACRAIAARAATKIHLTNGFTDNAIVHSLSTNNVRSTIIAADNGVTQGDIL